MRTFKKILKGAGLIIFGYTLHVLIEAFVITNILAKFGVSLVV